MTRRFPEEFWNDGSTREIRSRTKTADDQSNRYVTRTDGAHPATSGLAARESAREEFLRQPSQHSAVFVPRKYEQNYAYPLLIWLHADGGSERDLGEVMPGISPRNYMGLSFRGNSSKTTGFPIGYRWSPTEEGISQFADRLHDTVCRLRRAYHIHSERIFLAGLGEGATMALLQLLKHPEWFGGAALLNPRLPQGSSPLSRYRHLTGKRVLLAAESGAQPAHKAAELNNAGRLLFSAGMHVETATFPQPESFARMLRRIDHWVMDAIQAEQ